MKNIKFLEPLTEVFECFKKSSGILPGKFFKTVDGRVFQVCSYIVERINMKERTIVAEVIFFGKDKVEV